jgi:S-DNA-T family DNA segregation ATPase FtsK/SpoIIIE
MLERRGIISGYEGSKPRQVLASEAELPRMLERSSGEPESPELEGDGSQDEPGAGAKLERLSG